jgi:DMSO/TMAO reductase YedYZ heme-binding membrane subunit
MTVVEHNRILAIGFAVFAAIFAFTFLLLMVVSLGVFAALGITSANEPGNGPGAGIGIIGGVVAVIFYALLGTIFVLPMASASWKMLKRRRNARRWGTIAAILVAPIMPLGTMFGVYGLWFFFSAEGRRFYLRFDTGAMQALPNQ